MTDKYDAVMNLVMNLHERAHKAVDDVTALVLGKLEEAREGESYSRRPAPSAGLGSLDDAVEEPDAPVQSNNPEVQRILDDLNKRFPKSGWDKMNVPPEREQALINTYNTVKKLFPNQFKD